MYTIIYFILFGKDCQSVFPPNQASLVSSFTTQLVADNVPFSRIDTDENGNPIPNREEVIHG